MLIKDRLITILEVLSTVAGVDFKDRVGEKEYSWYHVSAKKYSSSNWLFIKFELRAFLGSSWNYFLPLQFYWNLFARHVLILRVSKMYTTHSLEKLTIFLTNRTLHGFFDCGDTIRFCVSRCIGALSWKPLNSKKTRTNKLVKQAVTC